MSFFSNKTICDQVKFNSLHIDPISTGSNGELTIGNGHIIDGSGNPVNVSAVTYSLIVDGTTNQLNLNAQSGNPSPLVNVLQVDASGNINLQGHSITNGATPVNDTDLATKQYVDTTAGGGGTDPNIMTNEDDFQISYTYSKSDVVRDTTDNNNYYISQADGNTGHQPVSDVSGTWWRPFASKASASGYISAQNGAISGTSIQLTSTSPRNICTFDTTAFSGKTALNITIDAIRCSHITSPGSAFNFTFYLSDSSAGVYNNAKSCLEYPVHLTSTGAFTVPNLNFVYTGVVPTTMYLVATTDVTCVLDTVSLNSALYG